MRSRPPPISPLDREILFLAIPAVGSGLSPVLHLWIDTLWVGQLPDAEAPLAALSIATFTRWIFSSFAGIVVTGGTALIARSVGAGRSQDAAQLGFQALASAFVISILIAVIGWFGAPVVFRSVTDDLAVIEAGSAYVRIFWAGGLAMLLQRTGDAVFRAHGNTKGPFLLGLLSLVANAVFDPIFMFGLGPIPAFGLGGAAYASVLAAGITSVVSIIVLTRLGWVDRRGGRIGASSDLSESAAAALEMPVAMSWFDVATFLRIARIGLPVAWAGVTFSLIYLALSDIVAETGGRAALAALGLGHRGESIAFVVCTGFADATASIVGRKLGAKHLVEAERAAWRATFHGGALCGLWAIVLLVFGPAIASLVATGETLTLTVAYYRITALCLIPQAIELILEGAFSGAGKTFPPMVITIALSVLRIPLAWMFADALGLGVIAIWWVLSLTAMARGAAMAFWFRRGTWKTVEL